MPGPVPGSGNSIKNQSHRPCLHRAGTPVGETDANSEAERFNCSSGQCLKEKGNSCLGALDLVLGVGAECRKLRHALELRAGR